MRGSRMHPELFMNVTDGRAYEPTYEPTCMNGTGALKSFWRYVRKNMIIRAAKMKWDQIEKKS